MNSRYPDATSEELTNDNTCIVCREVMVPWGQPDAAGQARRPSLINEGMRAKKLPCGHILHLRCLKAWLERQQACPTCRRPVIPTGTPSTDRTGAGNQNANGDADGGAQQGANAPAGAPNAGNANANRPAQPRLRMLNLGPIRIGVYNGPANRVQDALNQRRAQENGNATGTAIPAATTGGGGLAGARSMDTQLQLLQVEERLLQETRRLQIEQAQLATVRALEAELARLRAYYSNNQAGIGVTGPTIGVRAATPNLFPSPNMAVPGAAFAQPQVFQPGPGQVPMTQGHEGLPPGLVLPEGWTLAPLNRVEGTSQLGGLAPQSQVPTPTIPASATEAPAPQEQTQEPTTSDSMESPAANSSTEQSHNAREEQEAHEAQFSNHNEELSSMVPPQALSSSTQSQQLEPPSVDDQVDVDKETPVQAPVETSSDIPAQPSSSLLMSQHNGWGESSSWNFDNVDDVEAEDSTQQTDPEEQPKVVDKGKGRAVTVEDVEDAEQ